jgi:hypothetical protein
LARKTIADRGKRGRPPSRLAGTEDRFIMRIDKDLKDELRGAAEALRESGATMTTIVVSCRVEDVGGKLVWETLVPTGS